MLKVKANLSIIILKINLSIYNISDFPPLEVSISAVGSSVAGLPYTLVCTVSIIPYTVSQPYLEWINPSGNRTAEAYGTRMVQLEFAMLTLSAEGQYICKAVIVFDTLAKVYSSEKTYAVDVKGMTSAVIATTYTEKLYNF